MPPSGEVNHALELFVSRLRADLGPAVRDLRLFGSQARGDADEDSDIDVLVALDRVDPDRRRRVLDLAGDVLAETCRLISPTVIDDQGLARWERLGHPLWNAIREEGVPL
jgi:predicted nucleotidyltransferase